MAFNFMKKHQSEFRIVKMAQVFKVSVNGFYIWQRKGCPNEKTKDSTMIETIRKIQGLHKYRT